jgi:hypothetical protein
MKIDLENFNKFDEMLNERNQDFVNKLRREIMERGNKKIN